MTPTASPKSRIRFTRAIRTPNGSRVIYLRSFVCLFCSTVVRVVQPRFRPEDKAVLRRGTEAAANGKEIKETGEKGLVNLIGLFFFFFPLSLVPRVARLGRHPTDPNRDFSLVCAGRAERREVLGKT